MNPDEKRDFILENTHLDYVGLVNERIRRERMGKIERDSAIMDLILTTEFRVPNKRAKK